MKFVTYLFIAFAVGFCRNAGAQDMHLEIGKAVIPIHIQDYVNVKRLVHDSIIKDKRHRLDKFNLGKYQNECRIKPNEVVHARRETFKTKGATWTRYTDDDVIGFSYPDIEVIADTSFLFRTISPVIYKDMVTGINPVTFEENVREVKHEFNGKIYCKCKAGKMSKHDLIAAIKSSFGLPRQGNVYVQSISLICLTDRNQFTQIEFYSYSDGAFNQLEASLKALPNGSVIVSESIGLESDKYPQCYCGAIETEALIELSD